jgi:hypothetical protein
MSFAFLEEVSDSIDESSPGIFGYNVEELEFPYLEDEKIKTSKPVVKMEKIIETIYYCSEDKEIYCFHNFLTEKEEDISIHETSHKWYVTFKKAENNQKGDFKVFRNEEKTLFSIFKNVKNDYEEFKKLVEKVIALFTEYFLITGNPSLIENHLENDVKAMMDSCGINKERKLSYCEDPTIEEFENFLTESFQNTTATEIIILYCGHGTPDGTLFFHDDYYSGARFKTFLDGLKLNYYPQLSFYLNCCYALQFVNQIVENGYHNFFAQLITKNFLKWNQDEVKKILFSEEEYQKSNIGKMMLNCGRSLLQYQFGNNFIYFNPLSFSEMMGEGYLPLINNSSLSVNEFKKESISKSRVKFELNEKEIKTLLSSFANFTEDKNVDNPELTIFRGKKGDSALFCFEKNRILIDGGDIAKPCFWDTIKMLPKIDYVILTHGDMDHARGFIPFVQGGEITDEHVPKIENFVMVWSDQKTNLLEDIHRHYGHVYKIGKYIKEKGVNFIKMDNNVSEFQLGEINVQKLLPIDLFLNLGKEYIAWSSKNEIFKQIKINGENLKLITNKFTIDLQNKLKAIYGDQFDIFDRKITNINIFGISIIINCKDRQYLFTADCHSCDIIRELQLKIINNNLQKNFFYMDAPHHGSDENGFEAFYDYLKNNSFKIKHFVVSSDNDLRPGVNFLKKLEEDRRK